MTDSTGSIEYDFFQSPFGECLIACSDRGICYIDFTQQNRDEAVDRFRTQFANARISEAKGKLRALGDAAFDPRPGRRPPLDLRGTEFQVEVWSALLDVPAGTTATYRELAERIGRARAVRAVAGAVAANRIAFAVPCHRIVRSDGELGGFRWGRRLKAGMLAAETTRKHHGKPVYTDSERLPA